MNVLGISAFFHDSACCLMSNGKLVSAVQEERFSRIKNDNRFPIRGIRYSLNNAKLDITDIDCIAYYENPEKKLSRQLWTGIHRESDPNFSWLDPTFPEKTIREMLGYDGPIYFFDHHHTHAAASYFFSEFKQAAIYIADAVGEWTTTSFGVGSADIQIKKEIPFPDSIGLFYSTITQLLGFKVLSGEYKVMGLAPYGKPTYVNKLKEIISWSQQGDLKLAPNYFDFTANEKMFTELLVEHLQCPQRKKGEELNNVHKDISKSVQVVLEEIVVDHVNHLRSYTDSKNLCLGGGVALNCVVNSKILKNTDFEKLFIQPAAGDAGSSIGAAILAYQKFLGETSVQKNEFSPYLGPNYSIDQVKKIVKNTGLKAQHYNEEDYSVLIEKVIEYLVMGKVVGWFQGKMEFGPRALGARSILADPRIPNMRNHINKAVKRRESFRPFGPIILEEHMKDFLHLDNHSRYMLRTCQVIDKSKFPAVTHVDGSCRPQTLPEKTNLKIRKLMEVFYERTSCPILVNTSFNVKDEPIVASPFDAIRCMAKSAIDILVIENSVIQRSENIELLNHALSLISMQISPKNEIQDSSYTFI